MVREISRGFGRRIGLGCGTSIPFFSRPPPSLLSLADPAASCPLARPRPLSTVPGACRHHPQTVHIQIYPDSWIHPLCPALDIQPPDSECAGGRGRALIPSHPSCLLLRHVELSKPVIQYFVFCFGSIKYRENLFFSLFTILCRLFTAHYYLPLAMHNSGRGDAQLMACMYFLHFRWYQLFPPHQLSPSFSLANVSHLPLSSC